MVYIIYNIYRGGREMREREKAKAGEEKECQK